MNESNIPGEAGASPQSNQDAAAGVPAGHEVPATFSSTSHVPETPAGASPMRDAAQGAPQQAPMFPAPGAPAAQGAPASAPQQQTPGYGAAFGIPASAEQTLPVEPLPASASPAPAKSQGRGLRLAGLLVAAALVGGVAGVGGAVLWNQNAPQAISNTASGPQTVTVNNPGSVNETTAIAAKALPSVVTIEVAGGNEAGSGSGVILSKDGYVLTNTHVVTLGGAVSDPTIRVSTSDGRIYSATVVGTDPIYDLAVIKLKDASDLTPMEFADSSKLNVGDTVVALGAPLGLSNSVTTGIVSALNRSVQIASSAAPKGGQQDQQNNGDGNGQGGPFQFDIPGQSAPQQASGTISIAAIQTDAAINPGNSGGALVNSKGDLIGINVAIATAGGSSSGSESGSIGVGFSIPGNIAKRVSEQLIKDGQATHGLLGATVRDASASESATVAGASIESVSDGGAAAAAGLQKGDVVTEFDGVPITSASDLTAQVRALAGGSDAKLSYVRDGKTYEAQVTLGTLQP
ncbi:MAG: trypsin-like peptidase domain-containing protein [Microbacterium sp.]